MNGIELAEKDGVFFHHAEKSVFMFVVNKGKLCYCGSLCKVHRGLGMKELERYIVYLSGHSGVIFASRKEAMEKAFEEVSRNKKRYSGMREVGNGIFSQREGHYDSHRMYYRVDRKLKEVFYVGSADFSWGDDAESDRRLYIANFVVPDKDGVIGRAYYDIEDAERAIVGRVRESVN